MQQQRWLGVAAASALIGAVLAGSTPAIAAPAPMAPVSVSMAKKKSTPALKITSLKNSAGKSKLYVGGKIKVGGTASASLVGKKVTLQRLSGRKWVETGTKATVAKSRKFIMTARATNAGKISYRIHSASTTKLNAGYSKPVGITVAKKSTPVLKLASVKRATGSGVISSGESITVSGTTTKALSGKKVLLQRKVSGKWISAAASGSVSAKGSFNFTAKSAGGGSTPYRVISPSSTGLNAAASNTKTVMIYRWFNLSEMDEVGYTGFYWNGIDYTFPIAGKYYPHSIAGVYDHNYLDYNLSFKCARFRSTIGMHDSSWAGATGIFNVLVDGVERSSRSLGIGQSVALEIDVTQGFRIRIDDFTRGSSSRAAWGTPQVLCSSDPSKQ